MAAASASASSFSEITTDGPSLNLVNKRLRALRKKLNRITQMEESASQGKTLNKEQEETRRSKPSLLARIDELEKLRQPLSQAVDQEIELALEKNRRTPDTLSTEIQNEEDVADLEAKAEIDGDSVIDLLYLLYFASVFDVKTLMSAHDNMLTRTHERNCCLTYDYVTDDDAAGDPLKEGDLDLIALLGGLLVSRSVNSSLSHKSALQKCVEHAKLWLAGADQPIEPNSSVTYADLREKLNKIMDSDYFTTAPEIRAPGEVAAAAGNYTSFQVPVHRTIIPPAGATAPVEGSGVEYQKEEEHSPGSHSNEIYDDEVDLIEEFHQEGSEVENVSEVQAETELSTPYAEVDQNLRNADLEEQHASHRPYQNYRGGSRRGYGRGGRGSSRVGYQNGRGQYYDHPRGYHPRNNYNYRGRGGRGMGGNYNYHPSSGHGGHAQAAS